MFLVDHLHACVVQDDDCVAVCGDLGLEGLVLLDLGLQVGWVFVVLIAGRLQLLINPGLELIRIASEVLVPAQ